MELNGQLNWALNFNIRKIWHIFRMDVSVRHVQYHNIVACLILILSTIGWTMDFSYMGCLNR